MLFHEIYGSYYQAAASILSEAVRNELTGKKLNALVERYAFAESLLTIPDGLKGERWRLLHRDLTTSLEAEPEMPVTMLEKRWMKAMLLDPRMQLFEPDMKGFENVKPLFTPDMLVYYDRNKDGDDYADPDYIRHFRLILSALREKQNLYISFESGLHVPVDVAVTPCFLEYSAKDDRFRLIAAGKKRRLVINLSRIKACKLAYRNEPFQLRRGEADTVTFELEDRQNALERVLLHFSHLEKETRRLDEGTYRVTLRYDRRDETEMVIRILSFGPVIRVTEPARFASLIRERLHKQAALLMPEQRVTDMKRSGQ